MVENMKAVHESCIVMPENIGHEDKAIFYREIAPGFGFKEAVTYRSLHCNFLGFYSPAILPLSLFIAFIVFYAWQLSKKRKVSQ
jgi:hypothetical protein